MDPVQGSARGLFVSFVLASCGFPRPADVPDPDPGSDGPAYQLLAVTPAVATAGDTITLEGTFATTAKVQFPGGAVQAATVLGEHRATVVVPDAATAGDLMATTGGVTVGPLAFRRTSFALGLQPFRGSYEQTDGARQSPSLQVARESATATVINGWLYAVGGADNAGALDSVERAAINADGTIGSFDLRDDVRLTEARSGHSSVVIGTSLYLIGGSVRGGALRSVERASIHPDGSIGSFAPVQSSALVTARSGHASAIIGDFLYVIGGAQSDGTKLGSIERAEVQRDGSLGPFVAVPDVTLATGRSGHTLEVIGNALYVIGGDVGAGTRSGSVERAAIAGDGSLGGFLAAPATLTTLRRGHRSVVLGGSVYAIGGSDTDGATSSVERAPIRTDGSLGTFSAVSGAPLGTPRTGHVLAVIGTNLYALGGRTFSGPIRAIERSSINVDSALGPFSTSDIALVLARVHHTSTAIRDSMYVIGSGSVSTIERASVRSDGSLVRFATDTGTSLVTKHSSHATARVGNSLYVIGGEAPLPMSTIERAIISPDGSLGQFAVVSSALKEARSGHLCIALGNYLYVVSGLGINHTRLTTVERAVINDDGTLEPFATVTGVTLNTGRNYFTALVTDRYLYIMGGFDGGAGTGAIERATIDSSGSLGPFTPVSSLVAARGAHTSTMVGNSLYVAGGLTPAGYVRSIEKAIINADGSLGDFSTIPDLVANRARHTATLIGNRLYLIGGQTEPSGDTAVMLEIGQADLR